jgi:hypothetical protein
MAHRAVAGRNGNVPTELRIGLPENKFLSSGVRLRGHGGSFPRKNLCDSTVEAHQFE